MRLHRTLIALLVLLLATACTDRRSDEEMKDSIIYGYESDIYTFDPTRQRMMKETAVMAQVLEGLTRWSNDVQLEPSLATHWEKTDDCMQWTFHLREGVTFHDGSPFTSEAVQLHFERTLDPATAATRRHLILHLTRVETPDPLTAVFVLNKPDCVLDQLLASTFGMIPCPRAVANLDKPFGQNPVGTGPFAFKDWTPDVAIRLVRNPAHWNVKNFPLERIEFRPVRENTTRLILLEQGALDMADVYFAQVNVAKESDRIQLQTVPQLAVRYIGFNCQKPPFSDPRVRRAANYAVNRPEMIKYQFFGVGTPAQGPLPPVLPAYNKDINLYDFDPEKAKALLAEAGYPNGIDVDFWTQEQGEYRVAAEAVAEYLRNVGIRARIRIIDAAAYWKKFDEYITPAGERYPTREGVYDMYVGGWVGGEAEYDYLKPLFLSASTSNTSHYANPLVDEMLMKYQATPSAEERTLMLKELQRQIADDAPWIFAYHSQVNVGMQARVKGFRVNPSGRYFFNNVTAGVGGAH